MRSTPYRAQSLQKRAIMAVVLMIGFYALAFAIVAALLFSIVAQIAAGQIFIKLALLALIAAIAIIIAIFPRPDRFVPPGPRLDPAKHPRLFERINGIAHSAQQETPAEVYLVPDANAWVANRGGFMGLGSRRVMGIGLPLAYFLNVSELTAVIAHEFGHYHSGDTKLGPWIYKTRAAIGRTVANLSGGGVSLVSKPFHAYGNMFLRVTHSISRQQEYTADAFAASIAGPDALKSALARLNGYGSVYGMYWQSLVAPSLRSGFLPQIEQGLALAFASDVGKSTADEMLKQAMKAAEDPYDTHPPLHERVAALEKFPAKASQDETSAASLFDNVDGLWEEMLRTIGVEFTKLQAIDWADVSEKVFVQRWRAMRDNNRRHFADLTVGELPQWFQRVRMMTKVLVDEAGQPARENQEGFLCIHIAISAVAMALPEGGWTFVADPSRGSTFIRGEHSFEPSGCILAVASENLSPKRWLEICDQLGVREVRLGGPISTTVTVETP